MTASDRPSSAPSVQSGVPAPGVRAGWLGRVSPRMVVVAVCCLFVALMAIATALVPDRSASRTTPFFVLPVARAVPVSLPAGRGADLPAPGDAGRAGTGGEGAGPVLPPLPSVTIDRIPTPKTTRQILLPGEKLREERPATPYRPPTGVLQPARPAGELPPGQRPWVPPKLGGQSTVPPAPKHAAPPATTATPGRPGSTVARPAAPAPAARPGTSSPGPALNPALAPQRRLEAGSGAGTAPGTAPRLNLSACGPSGVDVTGAPCVPTGR